MTVEEKVANLTTSVDQLTDAVNVKKQTLDASVADGVSARDQSQGYRGEARTARDESQSHANTALGYSQDAASAVAYQDLTSIAETKAGTAVDVFVYDTSKDSDGGAWRHQTQHTSWYNEPLNTATRGGRREFPAVAVVVAEGGKLTIYDGDDPALPMWMVFAGSGFGSIIGGGAGAESVTAKNGGLSIAGSTYDLKLVEFTADRAYNWLITNRRIYKGSIAERDDAKSWASISDQGIISRAVNDVVMTVLPDAPIDQATGLPVPTIAVATDGGVSVIKDDGTVVDITSSKGASCVVVFGENHVYFSFKSPYNLQQRAILAPEYSSNIIVSRSLAGGIHRQGVGMEAGRACPLRKANGIAVGGSGTINGSVRGAKLWSFGLSESYAPETMGAFLTSTYNTGWMNGSIRGAFLSDTDDTDLVGGINLVTDLFSPDRTLDGGTFPWRAVISQAAVSGGVLTILHDHSSSPSGRVVDKRGYIRAGYTYDIMWTVDALIGDAIGSSVQVGADQSGNGGTGTGDIAGAGTHTATVTASRDGNVTIFARGGTPSGAVTGVEISAVSVVERDADRSVNNNGLIVNGTVTREPVAPGADLVAYSGFASSNYLEQPYNPDLDFGTGDFCVMGWVSSEITGSQNIAIVRQDEDTTGAGLGSSPYFHVAIKDNGVLFFLNGASYDGANIQGTGWRFVTGRRVNGVAELYIDGVLQSSGASNANLDNPTGTIRLGTRTLNGALEGRYSGSLALWRISATAPTPEQIKRIYEDEKVLFQENAQATLYGTSDAVTAMAHDEVTDLLHVGTSAGRSVFQGFRRVENTTDAVTTAISANNDMVVDQ